MTRVSRPRLGSMQFVDVDLIRELSHRIETEREPGETQHAPLMRLRRQHEAPEPLTAGCGVRG